jgi:ribonuclease R
VALIDTEAQKRGTSIYLQDRVIPMLPEVLSNDLCSLRENETKMTLSVVWTFGKDGRIKNTWMGRTVIRSNRRFTYEEVDEILSGKKSDEFKDRLQTLFSIAKKLNVKRIGEGSLTLEQEEIRFLYDEYTHEYTPTKNVLTESHMLIEEFMLLANKSVAEFLAKKKYTFPYRIHELPEKEKVETLRMVLAPLGFKIGKKIDTQTLSRLVKDPKLREYGGFIQSLVLRTLAKAKYSINNKGHFALAFKLYTHFTSPIRRYPDLISHRVLIDALANKKTKLPPHQMEKILIQATDCERIAQDAERYSLKIVQIQYMKGLVGTTVPAIVTGVTEHGIFLAHTQSGTEGLIHVSRLDHSFKLFPTRFEAVSKKLGMKIHIGMKVKVKVAKVNVERKLVDYELA